MASTSRSAASNPWQAMLGDTQAKPYRASGAGASAKLRPDVLAAAAPVARCDLPTRNSVKYSLWPAAWPWGLRDLDRLSESERRLQPRFLTWASACRRRGVQPSLAGAGGDSNCLPGMRTSMGALSSTGRVILIWPKTGQPERIGSKCTGQTVREAISDTSRQGHTCRHHSSDWIACRSLPCSTLACFS